MSTDAGGGPSGDASNDLKHVARALRRGVLSALLISDLRAGRSPSPEAIEGLGIDEQHPYTAVVVEVDGDGFEEHLATSGATAELAVVQTAMGSRVAALVPGAVDIAGHAVTLARSAPRRIEMASVAFAEAEQALATALAFELAGVVDLERLVPLPVVTATADLAAAHAASRFAGLDTLGPAGRELEETMVALLDHDQSIDAAAEAMGLHRNTIRARRRRFHELTGLDVRHTTDLVTAWWLLRWRQATRR